MGMQAQVQEHHVYVEKLEIQNVRCFKSTTLMTRHPDLADVPDIDFKNVTLLLGNNGAGKSTTLRSLAIGVLSRVLEVPFGSETFCSHGKTRVLPVTVPRKWGENR
jgi:ABC-type uncharacterized transport system ATPase subunit